MKNIITLLLSFGSLITYAQDKYLRHDTFIEVHDSTRIYGTITLPIVKQKVPLVLIIAGSGPTDRNGNNAMMKNNSLQMLADSLAYYDIASVRYDKRGIGKSKTKQKESQMKFDDMISDAKKWVKFFENDPRFSSIHILGHSEGSTIGMLAADKYVKSYISVAGPAVRADIVIRDQMKKYPDTMQKVVGRILDTLVIGNMVEQVPFLFQSIARKSIQPYMISWLRHDPSKIISGLKIPILVINGDKDLQVSLEHAYTLHKSNSKSKLYIIPKMNHVLKDATDMEKDNQASYNEPNRPLSASLIRKIIEFVK